MRSAASWTGLVCAIGLMMAACTGNSVYTEADLREEEKEQAAKDQDAMNAERRAEEVGGQNAEAFEREAEQVEMQSER